MRTNHIDPCAVKVMAYGIGIGLVVNLILIAITLCSCAGSPSTVSQARLEQDKDQVTDSTTDGVTQNPLAEIDHWPPKNWMITVGEPKLGWGVLVYPNEARDGIFTIGVDGSPQGQICCQWFRVATTVRGNRLPLQIPVNRWLIGKTIYVRHLLPPPPQIEKPLCSDAMWTNEVALTIEDYPPDS